MAVGYYAASLDQREGRDVNPDASPFTPGRIAPVKSFVGRAEELERLHAMVRASLLGRFKIGFVTGERGIGKSSAAAIVRMLSEREDRVAACHALLGGVTSIEGFVRRTFESLLNDSIDRPWHQRMMRMFGDRVRRVGLFGLTLELNLSSRDLSDSPADFIASIRALLAEVEDQRAILLILDDINGLAAVESFAHWLKSLVDEIGLRQQPMRLCMLFVCLEERRREMVARQPPLARVFELIDLAPWSDAEVHEFYDRSFRSRNATVPDEMLDLLASFTGGVPVLAHEIGDAVWRLAPDPEIDRRTVTQGIYSAADVVGSKLLDPQLFNALRSGRYRSILRTIAKGPTMRFRPATVAERLPAKERGALDNFLRRMRQLGALDTDPEQRGGYRFPTRLHALYFHMESRRA